MLWGVRDRGIDPPALAALLLAIVVDISPDKVLGLVARWGTLGFPVGSVAFSSRGMAFDGGEAGYATHMQCDDQLSARCPGAWIRASDRAHSCQQAHNLGARLALISVLKVS